MTGRADYADEEWTHLVRAPFVAGASISLADPGGPIELSHETIATLKTASTPPSTEQLLLEVAHDITSMLNEKQNPLSGFKPEKGAAANTILDELGVVNTILEAKATPGEADAFRRWLLAVAQAAANAAKEGGFLGIGAVRVSEGEEKMLQQLREKLGATES